MPAVEGSSSTNSGNFSFNYAEAKVKHECTHCGFEANLYDSGAEYECPICRRGTMCRAAQNIIFEWPWLSSQAEYEPTLDSVSSPPMADGYLFTRR